MSKHHHHHQHNNKKLPRANSMGRPQIPVSDDAVDKFFSQKHTPQSFNRATLDNIPIEKTYVDVYDSSTKAVTDEEHPETPTEWLDLPNGERQRIESGLVEVKQMVQRRNTVIVPEVGIAKAGSASSNSSTNVPAPVKIQAQYSGGMKQRLAQWTHWDNRCETDAAYLFSVDDAERRGQRAGLMRSVIYLEFETKVNSLEVALAKVALSPSQGETDTTLQRVYATCHKVFGTTFQPFMYDERERLEIRPEQRATFKDPLTHAGVVLVSEDTELMVVLVVDELGAYVAHFYIPPLRESDVAVVVEENAKAAKAAAEAVEPPPSPASSPATKATK